MLVRVLFYFQDQMSLDPVNYSFLSLVFPTFKLPSFQLDDRASVKILVTLVTTTNLLLMISLSIVYGLYQTDKYNPWCHEDLSEFKFEEELYQHSFWFFFLLFLAASFPTLVVYFTKVLRYFLRALNVVYFDKHNNWISKQALGKTCAKPIQN